MGIGLLPQGPIAALGSEGARFSGCAATAREPQGISVFRASGDYFHGAAQRHLERRCLQRCAGSLAGIDGNIGKSFRHSGNDYRRKCYYIYNDYLGRAAFRASGEASPRQVSVLVAPPKARAVLAAKSFVRLLTFSPHVILTRLRIIDPVI